MNYIAKQNGFIGGFRRKKGEVFTHEGLPGKWMELVKDQAQIKALEKTAKGKRKEAEAELETFSEMAHRDGAALSPKGTK